MGHFNKLIFFTLFSGAAFADCEFLGINKDTREYSFKCNGEDVKIRCEFKRSDDWCEDSITVKLEKYGVKFSNNKISSIEFLSLKDKTQSSCDMNKQNLFIECRNLNNCNDPINFPSMFEKKDYPSERYICLKNKPEVVVQAKYAHELTEKRIAELNIKDKVNSSCNHLSINQKAELTNLLSSAIDPNHLKNTCFKRIQNSNSELISEETKEKISEKVSDNITEFVSKQLGDCDPEKSVLFENKKLNFDKFLCFHIQQVMFLNKLSCNEEDSQRDGISESSRNQYYKDSGAEVARADTSGLENQTPKLIPKPAEMSEPIPVKGTLAKIDDMLKENNGIATPEVKAAAGKIFNAEVYERTKDAINYLDSQFFDEAQAKNSNQNRTTSSNGKLENDGAGGINTASNRSGSLGNDSSRSGRSRGPASKSNGKEERISKRSSPSYEVSGASEGESITIVPGGVRAGFASGKPGDSDAGSNAVNGGRPDNTLNGKNENKGAAARLNFTNQGGNQIDEGPPGTNRESSLAAGSGVGAGAGSSAGSGGQKVGSAVPTRLGGNVSLGSSKGSGATSGLGPGPTEIQKGVEVPPLNEKDKKELNQFANALRRIDNVNDLETVLRYSQNFPQLDYLIKNSFVRNQSPGGNSRVPASKPTDRVSGSSAVADPTVEEALRELVGRLEQFNVKVFDERIGETVYPTMGRDSDNAGRAAKLKNARNTKSSDLNDDASSSAASYIVRIDRNGNVRFTKPLRGPRK